MAAPNSDEFHFVEVLRAGDEAAFETLVHQYYGPMLRLALVYVNDTALAEEVIQDTWLAVLKSLSKFEGRSSLKTWIYSILINRARTTGKREGRYVELVWEDDNEPAVASDRFKPLEYGQSQNHWLHAPESWEVIPEERFLSQETLDYIKAAINELPTPLREVLVLRDVEHLDSTDICNILGISETNQRVRLHRARSRLRQLLDAYFTEEQ